MPLKIPYYEMDIPRLVTALADWLACLLYLRFLPPRYGGVKRAALYGGALAALALYLVATDGFNGWRFNVLYAVSVALMLLFMAAATRADRWQVGYFCTRAFILAGFAGALTWQMVVMWGIGALLIYLAIVKKMEPSLLLPMGFGAILVNLPASGAITQGDTVGPISALFEAGMSNELFPLLLFIGIGAMIDFGPLLEKPWLMLFGAAAQFGIFFTLFLAGFFFDMKDAASIAVIGAADGPTAIFVANTLKSQYLGAIMVAAYSYMALVPIVQPPVIRLLTTQKERRIRMPYEKGNVTQLTKILFPVVVTVVAGLVAPASVALVGFLMFGNLLRECGVLNSLSETAQNVLANLITLLLGLTVAGQMTADKFVRPDTLLIMALGLVAFIFDTAGGVLFAKLLNLFLPEGKKLNPMIGAAGISAFPMSGRVVNKMGLAEDNQNFLLMYSISVNVSGQIASVLAGGLILSLMA